MNSDIAACFEMHLRCCNCMKNFETRLRVPNVEGAPRDAAELSDSAFLQRQRFVCSGCDSAIATIVAIKELAAA